MRHLFMLVVCLPLLVLGCMPEEATDAPPYVPPVDAAVPVDADVVLDAAPDAAPQSCTWAMECPEGDCIEGTCVFETPARCPEGVGCPEDETCGERFYCFTDCEMNRTCPLRPRACRSHTGCPLDMVCHDGRCINSCITDLDCARDGQKGYCFKGDCRPLPVEVLAGAPPSPLGEPGQLFAGVGVVPLNYPMGVSMAGYGARSGADTPYNVALGGCDRVFEAQDVRAVALTTDEDILIVLRLPLSWSTDYIVTRTAMKLRQMTGVNYMGKIVTVSTHSHSQAGRYWNLVPETGFGVFGHGTFSQEMLERYTDSFADAAKAALDDLQPARFGWALVENFDPDGRVHSDRRGESPHFLDSRMMVWRVDDMDGRPMAGLVNFALHGTHMDITWLTGDAPGGVEVAATEGISAEAGTFVPVMFANGNGGNVSPRGDSAVAESWGDIQVAGRLAWPAFKAAWDTIETRADVQLKVITERVPMDYDLLGYGDPAEGGSGIFMSNLGHPQTLGAFQCVRESRGDDPYVDGELGCALTVHDFFHYPVPQIMKTVLTVFRIDNLVVTTLPGESTSELGVHLSQAIESDAQAHAGFEDVQVMNFGYSQDHQLYLVEAEDWFRGGYEASQGLWGWAQGDYLAMNSRRLANHLFTEVEEPLRTDVMPTWWPNLTDDTVALTESAEPVGALILMSSEAAARGDMLVFEWVGGHPGADRPLVTLEVQGDDGFVAATRVNGALPFDNAGFETLTIYEGDYAADHAWGVRWELPFDLAVGTYRLKATGHAWDGAAKVPYEATSPTFELSPATLVARDVTVEGGTLALHVNLPNGPSTDPGEGQAFEALASTGHWLRVDPELRTSGVVHQYAFLLGGAVKGALSVAMDDAPAVEVEGVDDVVGFDLVTARDAEGTAQTVRIDGWPTTRIEMDAPAAGAHQLTITDAHGNRVVVDVVVP